jgi:hypothetical protein
MVGESCVERSWGTLYLGKITGKSITTHIK